MWLWNCPQVNYKNVPSNTKILVINPKPSKHPLADPISPDTIWMVDGTPMQVFSQATYLGVVKTCDLTSNSHVVMFRIAAHSRSFYIVLNLGLAKNQHTPPSTSLRIESVYSSPGLYSGLATLILTKQEISTLGVYTRKILRQILKLHHSTALPSIHFFSGILPAEAVVHISSSLY